MSALSIGLTSLGVAVVSLGIGWGIGVLSVRHRKRKAQRRRDSEVMKEAWRRSQRATENTRRKAAENESNQFIENLVGYGYPRSLAEQVNTLVMHGESNLAAREILVWLREKDKA